MGGRIRLLPDEVVNQIAAGEVVERPASVLKEILENAVDAEPSRIEAEVSGGFPFTLRVSDDGCGMTAAEAESAVRRHTTSKISSAGDLQRIVTYGFRGEALPSIASVSRMRIVTRPKGQDRATEIVVEGGGVASVRETGAPPGTTVVVSDLFWNVPARRKFLKSPRTEMGHLWEAFHDVAIPREGISFRMTDGHREWSCEGRETRLGRALREAGEEAKYLLPVDGASPFFRLAGWVGLPHLSRIGSQGIRLYVNGRHFRDRGALAALREAYRGVLPPDRLPVAVLFIECDPAEVDVNVHPGKTEVRFRYARDLFDLLRHLVGEVLGERPGDLSGAHRGLAPAAEISFSPPLVLTPPAANPSLFEDVFPGEPSPVAGDAEPLRGGFASLRPVGQILGTYIVCEGGGDVYIIDQHAADERIVFSRLKDSLLGKNAPVQRWLVPQVVTLPALGKGERGTIEAFLSEVGFTFETFGGEAFKLTGGPAVLGAFDVKRWWKDFSDFFASQEGVPKGIFDADRELWRMACHTSLRGGKLLEKEGMRPLLLELDRAVAAHSCPHGRPVWVRISGAEMGRMFGRT